MNPSFNENERCALESIGHIQKKVCLMWGTPELDIFISRLIMDSRDGQRQGLPVQLGAELLFLAKTNKIIRAIDLIRAHQGMTLKDAMQHVEDGDQKRLGQDAFDNPMVSRDTVTRARDERRASQERATAARRPDKPTGGSASLGQLVFYLLTNKYFLMLIAFALSMKLLWPYFFKTPT